jgi:hypothetical protein
MKKKKKKKKKTLRWRWMLVTKTPTEKAAILRRADTIPMNKEEIVWSEHCNLADPLSDTVTTICMTGSKRRETALTLPRTHAAD